MSVRWYQLALEVGFNLLALSFGTSVLCHCSCLLQYELNRELVAGILEECLRKNRSCVEHFVIGLTSCENRHLEHDSE